jgi:hypothetical protein
MGCKLKHTIMKNKFWDDEDDWPQTDEGSVDVGA